MKFIKCLLVMFFLLPANFLYAGEVIFNSNLSDPAPKKMLETIISDFEKEYPNIKIKLNLFDHEGYKTSVRNFLTAKAPDLMTWYPGNRMKPFVEAGLLEDISDVWSKENIKKNLSSVYKVSTINGKQWAMPYTYYQWGIFYRKDIFKNLNIKEPKNWEEFLSLCEKLKKSNITPITIGTKYLWTAAGWFDYLNLRENGYNFHIQLSENKIPYTDTRVKNVFNIWKNMISKGYFIKNHATYSWQEAVPFLVQGKAAMYLIGSFVVPPLKEAGLKENQIGFFRFPTINSKVGLAEEAPADSIHIPKKAKNKKEAKLFLAYIARKDVQTKINMMLKQIPVNKLSEVKNDKLSEKGLQMLSKTNDISQFYDRDFSAQMAKIGMQEFQRFMIKPNKVDSVLKKLERARKRLERRKR